MSDTACPNEAKSAHNTKVHHMYPHYSPVIGINDEKFSSYHTCIEVCPVKFCLDGSDSTIKIYHELCIGCGRCIDACSHHGRYPLDDGNRFFEDLRNGPKWSRSSHPRRQLNSGGTSGIWSAENSRCAALARDRFIIEIGASRLERNANARRAQDAHGIEGDPQTENGRGRRLQLRRLRRWFMLIHTKKTARGRSRERKGPVRKPQ